MRSPRVNVARTILAGFVIALAVLPPASARTLVNAGGPIDTLIKTHPASETTSTTAAFSFSSNKTRATFECNLDQAGWIPCTSPTTYTALAVGVHTFAVRAIADGETDAAPASFVWTVLQPPPPPPPPPPPIDKTPPSNPSDVKSTVGYEFMTLRWLPPPDPDFDHVVVLRSTSTDRTDRGTPVYDGASNSYRDSAFQNGVYYRYTLVSYDQAGNASTGTSTVVLSSALLSSPRAGTTVSTPPLLTWHRLRGASFYNVQLYRGGRKILSIWPNRAQWQLRHQWRYRGRRETLSAGKYYWYVWPGFGPKTNTRYGRLLGYSVFAVSR